MLIGRRRRVADSRCEKRGGVDVDQGGGRGGHGEGASPSPGCRSLVCFQPASLRACEPSCPLRMPHGRRRGKGAAQGRRAST